MLKSIMICLLAAMALILLVPIGAVRADDKAEVQAAPAAAGIDVSFKLDPRLTTGMYMGERWVSPPTYTRVEDGGKLVVEARAQAVGANGRPIDAGSEWIPSDPEMVKVAPDTGKQVKLEILKEGRSYLTVRCGDVSKKLDVTTSRVEGALQVEISQ